MTGAVTPAHAFQRIDGFGGAIAYYGDWVTRHPYKTEIYDALFSPTKGMGLSVLRLQNYYRSQQTADGQPDPNFDRAAAEIVREADARRPLTILMSSWSPPAALKSNHDEQHGGTLVQKDGAYDYAGFGQYWRDALVAYRRIGISPSYVSLQNEPDWKADWDSCLFKPTEQTVEGVDYAGYDKALAAVADALGTLPAPPKLVGPEVTGIVGGNVEHYLPPANTAELGQLSVIGHHLYNGGKPEAPDSFLPEMRGIAAAYPDTPKWQTEFNETGLVKTAWLLHNALTAEQVSAYLCWTLVWPNQDTIITLDDTSKPRTAWKYPHGYHINDTFYAFKHYAYFVKPGYRRVGAEAGDPAVKLTAFVSPDKKTLVLVALNTSPDGAKTLALTLGGFAPRASAIYRTTSGGSSERFKPLGPLAANGQMTLPPESLATVVVTR